jgi:hypothetical protein
MKDIVSRCKIDGSPYLVAVLQVDIYMRGKARDSDPHPASSAFGLTDTDSQNDISLSRADHDEF